MTHRLDHIIVEPLVKMALAEDLGQAGDITTDSVIPPDTMATVILGARRQGRIAGLDLAEAAFAMIDSALSIRRLKPEGADVAPDCGILEISGKARSILKAERVALNFMGHMSGIATLTREMQRACGNHRARIAATRKTLPGLRAVEKYAVVVGGGLPHRMGLYDAILIKDNHIAMAGGIAPVLKAAQEKAGHTVKIEIEVDTLEQLNEILSAGGADIVMLDNMSLHDMARAVALVRGTNIVLEASGGVTLDRVPDIAATGVDLISSGFITHSAPNLDLGLDFKA